MGLTDQFPMSKMLGRQKREHIRIPCYIFRKYGENLKLV